MLLMLFLLPPHWWQALVAAVMLLTSWELLRLAGYSFANTASAVLLLTTVALVIVSLLYLPAAWQWWIIVACCGSWLLVVTQLVRAQTVIHRQCWSRAIRVLLGALFVVPTVIVFGTMQTDSPWLLLALLSLVWAADVFAYFVGKRIGGIKLASNISPNKTVAGLIGGMLGALLIAAGWIWYLQLPRPWLILAAALIIALISVAGDLLASLLKRQVQRKDSSSLLPGHGGLVDRLDSLMAAAPFYALTVKLAVSPMLQ